MSSAFPASQTPLHRDPNPNLHLQLGGRKIIRLFPPDIGNDIFEYVREQIALDRVSPAKNVDGDSGGNDIDVRGSDESASAAFRGDEMMIGEERRLLDEIVWGDDMSEMTGATDEVDDTVSDADHQYGSDHRDGEATMLDGENADRTVAFGHNHDPWRSFRQSHALEAQIGMGDTLFIPKGWWHAVRGIENRSSGAVVASVNWWFR